MAEATDGRTTTASAAEQLARFAVGLSFNDLPSQVALHARNCLIDTVAAAIRGAKTPAGSIVRQLGPIGGSGRSRILGSDGPPISAEAAAFTNAVSVHALELDTLRQPGAGVHPGAVLVPAALAAGQERGATGRDLLTAIVAGCEVLFRIGRATRHSAETRGFHAPGLTGPFGAAVAAGRMFGLNADAMRNALGIAGSLSGGLLEFAATGEGAMVKRLHLGRAAQSGITAARLAEAGFTGPGTVLEGRYGFLNAFCAESDPAALTTDLGTEFETKNICFKRYPSHITAHTSLYAIEVLRVEHRFSGSDVHRVVVEGTKKMAQLHANTSPSDLVMAQYSIPFCVAVGLLRDATDPDSFSDDTLRDPAIRDLCRRVTVTSPHGGGSGWATTTRLHLNNGRTLERRESDFPGTPSMPLDRSAIAAKFLKLTQGLGPTAANLLGRLEQIEDEANLDWLAGFEPTPIPRPSIEGRA